ncbi:hypothetical protein [uncultured Mediterranean phage uvMED]|nr:hypothetical protein [uncultured Mediterranean phage uvMED]
METENSTSEASAETEAENTNADTNLSMEDLASSFMEKVENESNESSTETTNAETDAEVVVAEEEESEVLSQPNTESEEEETEESDETQSKGLSKALKQINRLTARAKGAEEEVQSLKEQVQSLKLNPSQEVNSQAKPALDKINSLEDLEALRKEAIAAKQWAFDHIGKDFIEIDGKEWDDSQIRSILKDSEEYLTEKIPERARYLQEKEAWKKDTAQLFPYIAEGDGEDYEQYIQIRQAPSYKAMLDTLPNGDFIAGVITKGMMAIKAEQAKKPKAKVKTPPPIDTGDALAPPVESKEVRQKKAKEKILGSGNLSVSQFAQFLT